MAGETNRPAIGIDTCLLQVVDSFMSSLPAGYFAQGAQQRVSPNARLQFVEAVDLYLDPVGSAVVLPQNALGHLGTIGSLLAGGMTQLPAALTTTSMPSEVGVALYKDFLSAVAERGNGHRRSFRDYAVEWALFQLQDSDVLLGYADRMQTNAANARVFVKQEMYDQFAEAYENLDETTSVPPHLSCCFS